MDLMAIIEARNFLESNLDDFPKFYCDTAVRALNEIFGFERKAGVYVPTDSYHAWNYIPEDEMNLCITLSQFDSRYGQVYFSRDDNLFYEIEKKTLDFKLYENTAIFEDLGILEGIENLKKKYYPKKDNYTGF